MTALFWNYAGIITVIICAIGMTMINKTGLFKIGKRTIKMKQEETKTDMLIH